jgi:chromosome segregation ATPase
VVIGHRGVGKTSLIQLVRFCLGADDDVEWASGPARSILADEGRVSLALRAGAESFVVSRRASDPAPEGGHPFLRPLIFAQGEIEAVSTDPRGRLKLIDDFRRSENGRGRERELSARLASLAAEIADLRDEELAVRERLGGLHAVEAAFTEAREDAERISGTTEGLDQELADLTRHAAEAAER